MARTRTPPRRADEHLRWLRLVGEGRAADPAHPGNDLRALLPALTGCDYRALEAIDRLWQLYCYCDHPERVIRAIALAAAEMQESTRPLARELVAHAREWSDRDRLWPLVEEAMSEMRLW